MEVQDLINLSLEGCASLLLCVIAYKIYRARIDSVAESHCCKWLDFKVSTHNAGHNDQAPSILGEV